MELESVIIDSTTIGISENGKIKVNADYIEDALDLDNMSPQTYEIRIYLSDGSQSYQDEGQYLTIDLNIHYLPCSFATIFLS